MRRSQFRERVARTQDPQYLVQGGEAALHENVRGIRSHPGSAAGAPSRRRQHCARDRQHPCSAPAPTLARRQGSARAWRESHSADTPAPPMLRRMRRAPCVADFSHSHLSAWRRPTTRAHRQKATLRHAASTRYTHWVRCGSWRRLNAFHAMPRQFRQRLHYPFASPRMCWQSQHLRALDRCRARLGAARNVGRRDTGVVCAGRRGI